MPGRRFTAEQIVAKLREAEKLQGQGRRSRRRASGGVLGVEDGVLDDLTHMLVVEPIEYLRAGARIPAAQSR